MQYVQPVGGAANDPYLDANPAAGVEGSPVPAGAIEHPMREIVTVITGAGLTPSTADLTQLRQAIVKMIQASQRAVIIDGATFAPAVVGTGQAVYWDAANNRFDLAQADGSGAQACVGFADVPNGDLYAFGDASLFSGLTPGVRYYLNAAVAGAISPTPSNVLVGIARTAADMFVDIDIQATASASVNQRQTVLASPIDASGSPSFLPAAAGALSITSQGVSASTPLVVSAAGGFSAAGAVDRIGIGNANLTWPGLAANTTNYLYVDVAGNGTLTPGSTTLQPVYQRGGARSTVNGQAVFGIAEKSMTVGNGSSAVLSYRVFVGEAVTGSGTVTNAFAYTLAGDYQSGDTTFSASASYSFSANIGCKPFDKKVEAVCYTTDKGYQVGDIIDISASDLDGAAQRGVMAYTRDRNTVIVATGTTLPYIPTADGSSHGLMNAGSWKFRVNAKRGW